MPAKITLLEGSPVVGEPWDPVYDILDDGVLQSATGSQIVFTDGNGSQVVFTGTFTITNGDITGGTVTGFSAYIGPKQVLKGTGFDFTALDLLNAIEEATGNDNNEPFWELVWYVPLIQVGSARQDEMYGNGLDGKLLGKAGDDTVWGSDASELIKGGKGNDFIFGREGSDQLVGGSGKDMFLFNNANEVDRIKDFQPKDDVILLTEQFGLALGLGSVAKTEFRVGKSAKTADQHLVYNKSNGALSYDPDGAGGAAQIKFAQLDKGLDVSHKNFAVVAGYDLEA